MLRSQRFAILEILERTPWWAALLMSLFLSGSSFVGGAVSAVGFEFLPFLDKGQLIFYAAFYGSMLLLVINISRGLTIVQYRWSLMMTGYIPWWSNRTQIVLSATVVLISWAAVLFALSRFSPSILGATSTALLIFPFLFGLTAVASALAGDLQARREGSKPHGRIATLIPALIACSAFALGFSLVDLLRLNARQVSVTLSDGTVLGLRSAMTGENGMVFFQTTFNEDCSRALSQAIFIPWTDIRAVKGAARTAALLPAYLPGGKYIGWFGNRASELADEVPKQPTIC